MFRFLLFYPPFWLHVILFYLVILYKLTLSWISCQRWIHTPTTVLSSKLASIELALTSGRVLGPSLCLRSAAEFQCLATQLLFSDSALTLSYQIVDGPELSLSGSVLLVELLILWSNHLRSPQAEPTVLQLPGRATGKSEHPEGMIPPLCVARSQQIPADWRSEPRESHRGPRYFWSLKWKLFPTVYIFF